MHCVRKVTDNLYWVGANDHRLALFENIHPIPKGVSYNAYLLLDKKSVLFDTVDWSACRQLLENIEYLLQGKPLDYLVINHMEPDHGARSAPRPRTSSLRRNGLSSMSKRRILVCIA